MSSDFDPINNWKAFYRFFNSNFSTKCLGKFLRFCFNLEQNYLISFGNLESNSTLKRNLNFCNFGYKEFIYFIFVYKSEKSPSIIFIFAHLIGSFLNLAFLKTDQIFPIYLESVNSCFKEFPICNLSILNEGCSLKLLMSASYCHSPISLL